MQIIDERQTALREVNNASTTHSLARREALDAWEHREADPASYQAARTRLLAARHEFEESRDLLLFLCTA